jgi:hypothetical protein
MVISEYFSSEFGSDNFTRGPPAQATPLIYLVANFRHFAIFFENTVLYHKFPAFSEKRKAKTPKSESIFFPNYVKCQKVHKLYPITYFE